MAKRWNLIILRALGLGALGSQLAFGQAVLSPVTKENVPPPPAQEATIVPPDTLLPELPSMPRGKTTLIGGSLTRLDRIHDQLAIDVFGGQKMKVLFDERTHVYRDGERASQRDLQPGQKLYLDTMLDGSKIFARNIRIVTRSSLGNSQGQVLDFNAEKGILEIRDRLSPEPLKVHVAPGTQILRDGQPAAASLVPGALIALEFQPGDQKHREVRQIQILATPGSSFTFSGQITFLDVHTGVLVLVDPRDQKRYEVSFDPDRLSAAGLKEGAEVTVSASFDGAHYLASAFHVNNIGPQ
jgi:hypothetical protein